MAWTGDMNKYGLKYEILYPNEVWKDVSCLVSSPKMTVTENLFSSSFKSVISTAKLDLRYNNDTQKDLQQEIFSKMMEAKANFDRIGFRIKETATGKFPMNGFIDLSNITMVVGRLPRELSIEVENLITALDDDIQGSFQYPDIPVFDEQGKMNEGYCVYNPNDSANSIIPLLIMRCGLNITDLDMVHSVEILEKVPRIVYDADANTRTYRDLIDTLLYEHCAVLRQSDNGKLVISSFTYEKPEALREIAYTTENGLTMKGGDWQKDGWKIEWSTVDAVRQATVYQASITPKYDDKGEVLDSGEEIEALGYFPETGDLEPEYYEFDAKFLDRPYYTKQSRLKNKDLSLITTSNVTYELEADDRIEEVVAVRELHPLKARILLHNSDSDDVHFIRMFNMLGDCLFRKKINTYTYPEDAKKTEEYTTEFVTDEKVVNKLGSTLTSLSTHGDNTYSWTEFGQRGTVGDIVQITAPGTNISSLAVITSVSCSKANTDVWRNEYKAIGLVAYNALEPRKRSVVSGASSVEGKQGTPGNIKVEQYAIGDAIAPFTTAPEGSQSPETSMFLYNIGGEGYVLGGSDWELGEDSSWSTDIPTPSEGEYVWLRVGFYTPPALFPTVWQVTRLTGLVGASAKEVTIISTSDTLPTTSRGVPKIATIKFTALLKNMAITYASDITWECSDPDVTLVAVEGDIHSVLLYTSEVGTDSFYVTATIEAVVGQKAIAKIADGKPAPHNFGAVTEIPTETPSGEPLVEGDYFLWAGTTTDDYTKGEIYQYDYDNSNWTTDGVNPNLLMSMFNDFADLANDVDSTVIGLAVIKKLVAIEAFIENLFAQNATIAGILKSDNYSETGGIPTAGFQLDGPNSIVKMFEAVFGDQCTFYGKLLHSLLQTREAVSANAITIPAKTYWSKQTFIDFLTSKSLPSNSIVPASGTYNGSTITHVIKATGTRIRLLTQNSESGNSSYTIPYTSMPTYLYVAVNSYQGVAWVRLNGVDQVYVSEYKQVYTASKTVYPNKGDILSATTSTIYYPNTPPIAYADLVLPSSGYFIILSNGAIVKIGEYSNLSLSVTYGGTTWNSSSYINYVPGSSILALLTSLSQGIMLGATGTLVIDGTSRSIVSIFVQVSSALLYWNSTNHKEVLSTGYYNISGSFTPESVTAAVLTDILLPLVPADSLGNGKDIGTPVDRYRAVYTNTINTSGLGNFLIGQNLRKTDNVSFANINPPVDNNDISPPSIGKGGFTYAVGKGSSGVTLPSGGTYIVLAITPDSRGGLSRLARLSGGAHTVFFDSAEAFGYLIMRIA